MSQSKEKKIAEDINQLISLLFKNANQDQKDSIRGYSRNILGSILMSRSQAKNPLEYKELIMEKIAKRSDSKINLQCQQTLQKFLNNNSTIIEKKGQILKMLLKISQENQKSSNSFDNLFKQKLNKKPLHNQTLNQTQASFNTSHLPPNIMPNDSFKKVRNRGSSEQEITQFDLLREISYSLQNINGNFIALQQGFYNLHPDIKVTDPVRKITNQLTQIGWLFRKITQEFKDQGVITKAIQLGVQQQLNQYYRWLAVIENMISNEELTLRKLVLWSYEPFERLKWLAIVLQAIRPFAGCQIISIINSYRPQGSTPINELLNRLLAHVIQPLFQYIFNWVYKGQLVDQKCEFFISENLNVPDQWNDKYKIIRQNIPNVLDEKTAHMIFNTGKTIYFLRNKCQSKYKIQIPFIDTKSILDSKMSQSTSILSQGFRAWVKNVYQTTNQELVKVLFEQFKLGLHLQAMKMFFLTGKGDFIQTLAQSLRQELAKPKHQIYEYNLQGYIVQAIKNSYPQSKIQSAQLKNFRQNAIKRLNVKKVDFGTDGWDVFNFDYYVQAPISTILSAQIMRNYQKIFHFLWKIKRIQQGLKQVWLNHTKEYFARTQATIAIFHISHLLRNSMTHFLTNLYGYFMIAIESAWDEFLVQLRQAKNFDEILEKHTTVVVKILQITLNNQKSKTVSQALSNVFAVIANFKVLQLKLEEEYSDYFQRKRLYSNNRRLAQRSLYQEEKPVEMPSFNQSGMIKKVLQLKLLFDQTFKNFFDNIKKDNEGLNILAFRLDFSQYYSSMQIEK